KLLLEASLELAKTDAIVGMQDMGAAGIICSTSEMSAKGESGMNIDLSLVPLRQNNMEAWEILLSESQERMLVCIKKGKEHIVEEIFAKWDLNCARIGEVIDEDKLIFSYKGEVVAEVPAESLVLGGGAPVYEREYVEPEFMKEYKHFDINSIPEEDVDLHDVATFLTGHPNIASKRWVYEQYDSMVRTVNMTTNKPSDAGMVNVKGTNTALALTTDCNSRYVKADPEKGTAIAVAEAARNIACTGAKPVAITDCMNFGSPYNPQAYWQFVMSIKGMGEACRAFDTPVTGGNVSFYNQTTIAGKTEPVDPTPVIGMLGILSDKANHIPLCFDRKGDVIYLIGESADDINCSEYLYSYHRVKKSPAPKFDLDFEVKLSKLLQVLAAKKLVKSMHDVSDGGLYITLLESAMPNNLGFDITTASEFRTDAFLFGESQGRVVVSMDEDQEDDFVDFMMKEKIPFSLLGHVTKGELRIDDESFGFIKDAKELYDNAIGKIMEK
ncbi:MAG: phosphoribosylformylglycinamidine synthase II, partial [Bacteroidales bacterium]|nr:phosphoribosylformylglycinamidine synthase II [Bacteroidales bacterium]